MINYNDILNNDRVIEEYRKIDAQNKYSFNHGLQHIKNVCEIMNKLCGTLGILGEEKECLLIASALHDIGQVEGRDNHGSKARDYIINNFHEELKDYKYYSDILNAVCDHDKKVNLLTLPLFTNLVCFADKMDFTYKRMEKDYRNRFDYSVYEDVMDVNFSYENNVFTLNIKTKDNISSKDLFSEKVFFYKVITATITISKKLNAQYIIKVNDEIIKLIDIIKSNVSRLSEKISLNIDSIFIEQNGKIDKYFYKEERLHELYSVSKLIVSMAVGIAIEKKLLVNGVPLSLDTNIYEAIKNKFNITNNIEKISKWTLRDLLLHATGYEKQMLSERFIVDIDKKDLVEYALNYEMPYDVGERYTYNNCEPFIISVLFSECFNINLSDFVNQNIFKKIGINEYIWDNYDKYCSGATGLQLGHTDYHKIGQLLLNNGKYNGEQIIPEAWLREMIKMQMETPTEYKEERVFPKIGAGYYTFISRDGYVFRDGKNGQYIILNRDKDLLITVLSSEMEMKNITEIFRDVL